ncbi:hypothetical protein NIES22_10910 [Calothrix brevissima NIES-22]|nr:hypothetical protein NIES22_10910 [Calothrix brevissima NIES-22]
MKNFQIYPFLTFFKADLSSPSTFYDRKITGQYFMLVIFYNSIDAQIKAQVRNIRHNLNFGECILAD